LNAVAYKGCRIEAAGLRSNTAPRLIDVAAFFIDPGDIAELVGKDSTENEDYDAEVPSIAAADEPNGNSKKSRNIPNASNCRWRLLLQKTGRSNSVWMQSPNRLPGRQPRDQIV